MGLVELPGISVLPVEKTLFDCQSIPVSNNYTRRKPQMLKRLSRLKAVTIRSKYLKFLTDIWNFAFHHPLNPFGNKP